MQYIKLGVGYCNRIGNIYVGKFTDMMYTMLMSTYGLTYVGDL